MELRPGYKLSDAGVIPDDWRVMPFFSAVGSYIDFRGRTPRKVGMSWGGGNLLALSANNVQMGRIDTEKEAYFGGEELYKKWMTQGDCERGDVLLTMEAPLGNVAQIPDDEKYILSQRVLLIKPKAWLSRSYLTHYMRGSYFQLQLALNATGSTAKGIQRKKLDGLPIFLPPTVEEQEAIAEALSDADALIESLEQLVAKKRLIKQGAKQELLRPRREWTSNLIGHLFRLTSARSKSSALTAAGRYVVLDMGSVSSDGEKLVSKRTNLGDDLLAIGDLVMPKDDIGGGQIIGKVAFVDCEEAYVLGDHVYRLSTIAAGVEPLFFHFLINSRYVNQALKTKVAGSAQLMLGRASVLQQAVHFPSDAAEQRTIASTLSDMDAELAAIESKLTKARQMKQGMMQNLLTGRIRLI